MKELHVFDAFARTSRGRIMHFDVILAELNHIQAIEFAKSWLKSVVGQTEWIGLEKCLFCHSTAANRDIRLEVKRHGYAIKKLSGFSD